MKQKLNIIFLISVFLWGCDKVYVRKNIYSLPATDPIVIDYQKGVAVMKTRPITDPTSWDYQANMHGTDEAKLLPLWATCQHGSYYFLSWHRMYLYFFERIVRNA
ncbi:MAG TPA: tyrosinase family protein, partial [Puia sp.]|nr:tyrosinase family protein [Puia sp.]